MVRPVAFGFNIETSLDNAFQNDSYEKEESIHTLRGRIDFSEYATNYHTGNAHVLPCIYDSLEINNLYNQIIKIFGMNFLLETHQKHV